MPATALQAAFHAVPFFRDGLRTPAAMPACLPQPQQLAALGTVLCLYPASSGGGDLGGWRNAVRVRVRTVMDSDGPRESLEFFDAGGVCCWRLYLLPDSDFLAWERLAAGLPRAPEDAGAGIAGRLWQRLATSLSSRPWHCSVLRLHVPVQGTVPAASLATVSVPGAAVASRIAHAEGVVDAEAIHRCCCSGPERY